MTERKKRIVMSRNAFEELRMLSDAAERFAGDWPEAEWEGCYPAHVAGGRLLVDAPTRLSDGTAVPLELGLDFNELTDEHRAGLHGYEGRVHQGVVRNGRLVVDEPTVLPDGIPISLVEDWPLPPEQRARLDAELARRLEDAEEGRAILGVDVTEALRVRGSLAGKERDRFDAECDAELERRFVVAAPGACIRIDDILARWKTRR